MTTESSLIDESLLSRMRSGDDEAAALVFQRYAEQLARLADQHLSQKVGRRVDGSDVVQSVFRSFFHRAERGCFVIKYWDQLWKLLVHMTLMKAAAAGRQHTADKRDVRQEESDMLLLFAMSSGGPSLEDAQRLDESIESALQALPVEQRAQFRQLLELKLANYSPGEIALEMKISRRTVDRMNARLQTVFQALLGD